MPKTTLNIRAIADKIGLSPWTIRLKIKSGELPAYRIGGVWRADENEIDDWLRARHQPGRATRLPEVPVPA